VNSSFPAEAAARVTYLNTLLTTGWDELNVTTNAQFDDDSQAFTAGYGEGYLTYEAAWYNYQNNQFSPGQPPMPENITSWVQMNWAWMTEQVALHKDNSSLWKHVGLQMTQFNGLLAGINAAAPANQTFSIEMLWSINLAGDLMDLYGALNISMVSATWREMAKPDFERWFTTHTHCSALVKLTYDYSDIFIGHATWSTYNMMMRSYKSYTLNYKDVPAATVSFSGYGGTLASIDDFYTTSQDLVITETSFSTLNMTMYEYVQVESLLYWVRTLVANRLATSASEWVNLFAQYNSGTYNNQWIVLDMKKFTPYQDLLPETLMIAEQFPGVVGIKDRTKELQYGYWPSYNIPSIPELYVISGNQEAAETQGYQMNDYERCVRAQIFRRDQSNVVDMDSFKYIMQYNQYETDVVSQGNPTYTIAARGDLCNEAQGGAMCFGAIDAKVTSASYMKRQNGRVDAYSGPSPQQGPFDVLTTNATMMCTPHFGQPVVWNFSFVEMHPSA